MAIQSIGDLVARIYLMAVRMLKTASGNQVIAVSTMHPPDLG